MTEESESEEEYFVLPPGAGATSLPTLSRALWASDVEEVLPAQPDDDLGLCAGRLRIRVGEDARTSDDEEATEDPGEETEQLQDVEEHPIEGAEGEDIERPRRSGRERRKPQWHTSGAFHMAQQPPHQTVPWRRKAALLRVMLDDGSLAGMSDTLYTAVVTAILNNYFYPQQAGISSM